MNHQTNPQAFDDLVTNLQQAEAMLSAIVDQACLNGPDVVKPAALIAAHNLTHEACANLDELRTPPDPKASEAKPVAVDPSGTKPANAADRLEHALCCLRSLRVELKEHPPAPEDFESIEMAIADLESIKKDARHVETRLEHPGGLLELEVPLRLIHGQAHALWAAIADELPGDAIVGAGEALAVAAGDLCDKWKSIHEDQRRIRAA